MSFSSQDPTWPQTPQEFLAGWSMTKGNLRRFFEELAMPPINASSQRRAGEASAALAAAELFDLDLKDYASGLDSVSGALEAAGSSRISAPDPNIPQDVGAAAFFDIDNTLIQGSSLAVFFMELAKRRFFKLNEILPVAWKQAKYRLTGAENAQDVAKGREQALEFVKGREVAELVRLCEEIVDSNMSEKLWPGTKALADQHLAQGQQVWLVSATPVQLAQVLAKRLGFTGALGTVAEVEDGRFSGRLVGDILHGPGKRHAVAALATLEQLDLSRCTAYSDSVNDVPMLSMVGTAVAVNPDRKLRKEALRRGWEIRDYRSLRKAVRAYGAPALATAALSLSGWKYSRRAKR
ncbi:HAD-IB family hydrolase [Corynebacterium pelargi]|uniref:Phosphoserine phosphatase n=1 Tax=Corynebacterium pelargi TaxID=1471400 RepID=A0A410WBC1_9CORY|nr:HAD-IB family hydrolase [Corynebacterium pelargi]QAU53234.1 Phosphoserine phosphatase [Corynebacterium pelargi]GGG73872.1 phosphoserine phosphatase [Corynebacterium pelargi]